MENLRQMLMRHEGVELKPYRDTKGKLTIGVGRNIDDRGISMQEAMHLLDNDIAIAAAGARQVIPGFSALHPVRQDVVVSMIFQLGLPTFKEFKQTISAINMGAFTIAAAHMLDSEWGRQVPERARELSGMMLTGQYRK